MCIKCDHEDQRHGNPDHGADRPIFLTISTSTAALLSSPVLGLQPVSAASQLNIAPEVEIIPVSQVNEPWERVVRKQVRYRYVIDMQTMAA